MSGQFDDLPDENFGNLKPLPEGYVVVWFEGTEHFHGTKRGTDIDLGLTCDRYDARRCCFAHAARRAGHD